MACGQVYRWVDGCDKILRACNCSGIPASPVQHAPQPLIRSIGSEAQQVLSISVEQEPGNPVTLLGETSILNGHAGVRKLDWLPHSGASKHTSGKHHVRAARTYARAMSDGQGICQGLALNHNIPRSNQADVAVWKSVALLVCDHTQVLPLHADPLDRLLRCVDQRHASAALNHLEDGLV